MVLTVAYPLEAGFGVTDGDQRNEDHVESLPWHVTKGRVHLDFYWGWWGMKG